MNSKKLLKRIAASTLALVMALTTIFIVQPTAYAADEYSTIRVKLSIGSVTTSKVGVNGRYFILENNKMISTSSLTLVANSDGTVSARDDSGNEYIKAAKFTISRLDDQQGQAGVLRIYNDVHGWRNYLGHLQVLNNGGKLLLVNYVYLEKYLYGVVAYEMNNSWPLEALKAQAVAARGYAVRQISPTSSFDVVDTASDQVYKGYEPLYSTVISAVDSTKHQVLMSGSNVITAYYGASNGGQTDSYTNVFGGTSVPYLPVKDDPYDTRNPLSLVQRVFFPRTVTAANINARLVDYLKAKAAPLLQQQGLSGFSDQIRIVQIPSVELYAPKYPSPSRSYTRAKVQLVVGATAAATTTTPTATAPVQPVFLPATDASGNAIMDASGNPMYVEQTTGQLVDQAYKVAKEAAYEQAYAAYAAALQGTQPAATTGGTVTVTVDFLIADLKDTNQPYKLFTNSALRMYALETTNDGFYISNVRYGHGVGMSQRGAQQQAIEGRSYRQILDFYYPSTALTTLNITEKAAPVPQVTVDAFVMGTMSSKTTLRASPSTSAKSVRSLPAKTLVGIVEQNGEWVKVQDDKGNLGYVMLKYVTLKITTAKPVYATMSGSTYLYASASTGSKKQIPLPQGTLVSILSRSGRYFKVAVNGKTGYIPDKFAALVLSGTVPQPTVAPTIPVTGAYSIGSTFQLAPAKVYGQVTNADTLPIHQSPSLTAVQLGNMPNSYLCEVLSKTPDERFYKVSFGGITGYSMVENINIMPQGAMAVVMEVTQNAYKITLPTTTAYILQSMVGGSSAGTVTPMPTQTPTVVTSAAVQTAVALTNLSVYAVPSTSGPVLATYGAGNSMLVLEKGTEWHKVAIPNGSGYVLASSVTLSGTAATPTPSTAADIVATGTINADNVNLRTGAATDAAVVTTLAKGTTVYIYLQKGDFYKVSANGSIGYVSKQFVGNVQSASPAATASSSRKLGWVNATSLKMYSQATTSSTVIATIKKYYNVDILSSTSSYYKIKTADGKVGFVSKSYITLLSEPATANTSVNIRKTASTSASVLGKLSAGDVVEILDTQGDWYKVSAIGVVGYVMSSYVTLLN